MTHANPDSDLSRRERQLMEILYRRGRASAREIHGEMPEGPGYSTIRKLLGILVEKGHLLPTRDGARLIYQPKRARGAAARGALRRLLDVFYDGSVEEAVAGLISLKRGDLSSEALDRLAELIDTAQEQAANPETKKPSKTTPKP